MNKYKIACEHDTATFWVFDTKGNEWTQDQNDAREFTKKDAENLITVLNKKRKEGEKYILV